MPPAPSDAGVTRSGDGLGGTRWNILGQIYRPVQISTASFAFDASFPPGTFVPPHVHPDQDEFIRVLDGTFSLMVDGAEMSAGAGDLVRLPMGSRHGIFNRSDTDVHALFWVAPARALYDLFVAIDGVADPADVVRIAGTHNVHFLPPG